VTFPPGLVTGTESIAIDVFATPPALPLPLNATALASYFVNLAFTPALSVPLPSPGITIVLPLVNPITPGANLRLYHIDPATGQQAPAMNAFGQFVVGTVNSDGSSATFLNVVTLSTVAAYLTNGSLLGDVDGNGVINCNDLTLVQTSFGKRRGQAGFNSAADFNNDGVVNILDLFLITRQLQAGTVCQ